MSQRLSMAVLLSVIATLAPRSIVAQDAALTGRVLSAASEAAVRGALVEIPALSLSARSDSLGAFRLERVPAGTHQVIVRALGFDPWSGAIGFAAGATVEAEMLLGTTLTRLAPLRVRAERADRWEATVLEEFEERRRSGQGKFLTKEFFERNAGRDVGLLIARQFAGLRHNMKSGLLEQVYVARRGVNCVPNYVVNGVYTPNFTIGLLQASEILGFEFHSAATLPAKYNVTQKVACGTFIVWLK